jgi:hypothetical protein
VGEYQDATTFRYRTLIMRWNGTQWSVVPSPNVGTEDNQLKAVAAVSANEVWAVGRYSNTANGQLQTLIMRWNGNQWSVVNSPNVGTGFNYLEGVAAAGPNDVWAVGQWSDLGPKSLILRWNGSQWNVVAVDPNLTNAHSLYAVTAISANDVWAVGTNNSEALALHWDGQAWTRVPGPSIGGTNYAIWYAVSGTSSSDVWAVGTYYEQFAGNRTMIGHWNGTAWRLAASPNPTEGNLLYGVGAVNGNDAWAAGVNSSSSQSTANSLLARYMRDYATPNFTPTITRSPTVTRTVTN